MGRPMAARLLGAGFRLLVWNRTRAKAEPLIELGARWADSPAATVAGAGVVITMMTDGRAVTSAIFDSSAADAMSRGTMMIDMSTTTPQDARDFAARLVPHGIDYIDAPVSGGTRGATSGTLAIMAGGDAQLI